MLNEKKLKPKLRQIRKRRRLLRKLKNRAKRKIVLTKIPKKRKKLRPGRIEITKIIAPRDFRLIENPQQCLEMFRGLRKEDHVYWGPHGNTVQMDLRNVEKIDYGTISFINAISDDLKTNNINLRGNFPLNRECADFMLESGFLNHMYINNQSVKKAEKSDLIFFEKGSGILSDADGRKIGELIKNVMNHLTGKRVHNQKLRTIILEICGNSIEHASTSDRQWLLGVNYQEDRIVFTVSDVGKGILETLHRKFSKLIADLFVRRDDHQILARSFEQKYGSSTKETNRNKGLPAVKYAFDNGSILNLITITNNVVLNFANPELSITLPKGSARLKGTFYQWEITKECLN